MQTRSVAPGTRLRSQLASVRHRSVPAPPSQVIVQAGVVCAAISPAPKRSVPASASSSATTAIAADRATGSDRRHDIVAPILYSFL